MDPFKLTVKGLYAPKRIDAYLAQALADAYSREEIKRALEKGDILLNGLAAKPRTLLKDGDAVTGHVVSARASTLIPEKLPLKIIYEDKAIIVVDKPAGMVVHPGAGNKQGTLVHALLGHGGSLSTEGGKDRPGIVHRLDKETSGVLVIAKNNKAHRHLQEQFLTHSLSKTYIALVKGRVDYQEGRVTASLDRHPKMRERMAVSTADDAKEAETRYRVLKRFKHATLLELNLISGRTHQIRVHMAHIGHPVAGDAVYGTRGGYSRHALHAAKMELVHPVSGNIMVFEAEWPEDFKEIIRHAESEK